MWTTTFFSLLILFVFGGAIPYGSHANDEAQKFINWMIESIESKDEGMISGLFQPTFNFTGCHGTYDKEKTVKTIMMLPADRKFVITLTSAREVIPDLIRYTVMIHGFTPQPIFAEFTLNRYEQQLIDGKIVICQNQRHFAAVADTASDVAQKFLDRMVRSVKSKDVAVISGLFNPNFEFKGCKGTYNKQQVVGILSKLPSGTPFAFTLKSAENHGSDQIKYTVTVVGFGQSPIEAEFILNISDAQLQSGSVPACQKSHFIGFAAAADTASDVAQKFLDRIVRSVKSKDVAVISGLFNPSFEFKGCKGTYNKQQVVGILSKLPSGAPIAFTLKSAEAHGSDQIKYTVTVSGFGQSAIEAEFILNTGDQQLQSGSVPACQKSHFMGFAAADDTASDVAQKFLDRLVRSVKSKDVAVISGLFNPNFEFKGCKGTYNKQQVVGILSKLPSGTPFAFTLKSAEAHGSDQIKYTVTVVGFGQSPIEAEFILNIGDAQLQSGSVPACQKSHFIGFAAAADAEAIVKKFLDKMTKTIETRDASLISGLFVDNFVFKGCKGTYTKKQVVGMLSKLPPGTPFSFSLKSAKYESAEMIVYTVSASGIGAEPIEAEFYLSPSGVLNRGGIPSCPKSHFHGFVANDAGEIVQKFLIRMARAIESKDESIISGLFQPEFEFKGCTGSFSKGQVVARIVSIPTGTKFSFTLKSAEDLGSSIKYTVSVTGFSASAVEAEYRLNKIDQQLESGRVPTCPKSHFHEFIAANGAEEVVQKFLARMTRSIESKDVSIINGLFQPGFVFKGCKGTYDKAQIVAKLSSIPTGTKFTFTLKSAEDLGPSIKYIVSATGFGATAIEAEFHLNKIDQQLESGSVPACQKAHSFFAAQQENAPDVVVRFLGRMAKAIETKNSVVLSTFFAENFNFEGCEGSYNKQKAVGMISKVPSGTHFTFTLKSAKYISADTIEYSVSTSGFTPTPIESVFYLSASSEVLTGGKIPSCPPKQLNFYEFIGANGAEEVVQKFLARLTRSIESKDVSIINGLFQPGFVFKGCKGVYNKAQIVAKLSSIPTGTKFTFTLKSAEDLGSTIIYIVSATGFGATAIEAEFHLNKIDQQLESGSVPACQKTHFYEFIANGAEEVVQKFLARLTRSIESKDVSIISGLFQPGFEFKGCKGTYNKAQIVAKLSSIPAGTKFAFTLKSAEDLGSSIKYIVSVTGFGKSAAEAEFHLNKIDQQLESGRVPGCQKSHFHGFVGNDEEVIAQTFLDRMTKAIESKDESIISELFDWAFYFEGCQGKYNKSQIVAKLLSIPSGTKFNFTLKSARDNGLFIRYVVSITGFGAYPIEAEFDLHILYKKLQSGSVPACEQKKLFLMGEESRHFLQNIGAPESANVVIGRFLRSMKQIIATRDAKVIGGIFDDNFVFKGCKKSYTKTEAVGMLTIMSPEAPFSFTLKSANYNNMGQIEYTVTVFGAGPDSFDANFVYCPFRNLLKSGNRPNCPNSRMFAAAFIANGAEEVVQKFLDRMRRSIESDDTSVINALFQPGFEFKGCKGTYSKADIVAKLASLSFGAPFDFTLESAEDLGSSIKYRVLVTGFGASDIEAEFYLNKINQQLESGSVLACQKPKQFLMGEQSRHFLQNGNAPPPASVVNIYLDMLRKAIASHDRKAITSRFGENFHFRACRVSYVREEVVDILMQTPPGSKFDFKVKSAEYVDGGYISYVVSITDADSTPSSFEASFYYYPTFQFLRWGKQLNCPKTRKFAAVAAAPEPANAVIGRFLGSMKQIIATRDASAVGRIFDDNFVFKGCKGSYSKTDAVGMLTTFSPEAPFSFTLKSATYNNMGQIEYTVTVSVPTQDAFDANFVYCPYRNLLKSGNRPNCAARRHFYEFY